MKYLIILSLIFSYQVLAQQTAPNPLVGQYEQTGQKVKQISPNPLAIQYEQTGHQVKQIVPNPLATQYEQTGHQQKQDQIDSSFCEPNFNFTECVTPDGLIYKLQKNVNQTERQIIPQKTDNPLRVKKSISPSASDQ